MSGEKPMPIRTKIHDTLLTLHQGDITKHDMDAIVNAANSSLLSGGGVDGAIHRAAGKELLAECRQLRGCNVGEAKITGGYLLPAKHIIHTVGPTYYTKGAADLLASCFQNSLELAQKHGLRTIAFPAISTGAYGYPLEEAAPIALQSAVDRVLQNPKDFTELRFVLFTPHAVEAFIRALETLVQTQESIHYVD